tara:strand:+ start:912 stop:1427 length:516 start_codon:yes stop_codon:yes gene_type:complete
MPVNPITGAPLPYTNQPPTAQGAPSAPSAGGIDLGALGGMDVDNLPPEVLSELMQLGVFEDQLGDVDDQISYAQEMRNDLGPQGVTTGSGNNYTAPSPLSHIAHGVKTGMANRDARLGRKSREGIYEKQTAGRGRVADMIAGLRGAPAPPATPVRPELPAIPGQVVGTERI